MRVSARRTPEARRPELVRRRARGAAVVGPDRRVGQPRVELAGPHAPAQRRSSAMPAASRTQPSRWICATCGASVSSTGSPLSRAERAWRAAPAARGSVASGSRSHGPKRPVEHEHDRHGVGQRQRGEEEDARAGEPDPHRERPHAGGGVAGDVGEVVRLEHGRDEQAGEEADPEGGGREGVAGDRRVGALGQQRAHEPDDQRVAEPVVLVGPRAAGVEPAAEDARQAVGQQRPRLHRRTGPGRARARPAKTAA